MGSLSSKSFCLLLMNAMIQGIGVAVRSGRSRSPELSWAEFDLWFEVAFKIAGNPENCGKSSGVSWSMVTFCVVVLRV